MEGGKIINDFLNDFPPAERPAEKLLMIKNKKSGWEGGKNFQNPKFLKITTVTTTSTAGL